MELKNYFAQDQQGNVLPDATCYLYERGTETQVQGLKKANGLPLSNPFLTDSLGFVQFAAPNGLYDLLIDKDARNYRIRLQFNDVAETVQSALTAANRSELARDQVLLAAGSKDSIEHGLVSTSNGQTFSVVSASGKGAYLILYKNENNVAVEVNRLPDESYVSKLPDTIFQRLGTAPSDIYHWISSNVETVIDQVGQLRILMTYIPGEDPSFYGVAKNISPDTYPAISRSIQKDTGIENSSSLKTKIYPDELTTVKDAAGQLRVLSYGGNGWDFVNLNLTPTRADGEFVAPTGYYVWLILNQSNQDGRGNKAESPVLPEGMAYVWRDGALHHLADPTSSTTNSGSAWPAYAKRFYELTGFGSVFVTAAVGGTPQTAGAALTSIGATKHWDVGGTLRETALSRLQDAFVALDSAGIMWQMGGLVGGGGERDAQNIDNPAGSTGSITAADYKAAVQGMLAYFQSSLIRTKLPFIMSRLAMDATGDTTGFQQIRAAQMDLCANVNNIYMSWTGGLAAIRAGRVKPDTYDLHFLQQDLNDMGQSMATVAASTCLGRA